MRVLLCERSSVSKYSQWVFRFPSDLRHTGFIETLFKSILSLPFAAKSLSYCWFIYNLHMHAWQTGFSWVVLLFNGGWTLFRQIRRIFNFFLPHLIYIIKWNPLMLDQSLKVVLCRRFAVGRTVENSRVSSTK